MTECDAYKLAGEFVKTTTPTASSSTSAAYCSSSSSSYTAAPSLSASSSTHSPNAYATQFPSTPHCYTSTGYNAKNELPPELIAVLSATATTHSTTHSTTSLSSKMLFSNFNSSMTTRKNQRPFLIDTFNINNSNNYNVDEIEQTFSDEYSSTLAEYIPDSPLQPLPLPMINLLAQAGNQTSSNDANENGGANLMENSFYQRPNRPYSYYLATNFNPLDLSHTSPNKSSEQANLDQTLTQSSINTDNASKIQLNESVKTAKANQKAARNKNEAAIHEEQQQQRESRSMTRKLKKRLSTSMSDMLKSSQPRHKSPAASTSNANNTNADTTGPAMKNYALATLRNLKSRSQNYFSSTRATNKIHRGHNQDSEVNNEEGDYDLEHDDEDEFENENFGEGDDEAFEEEEEESDRFQRMNKFSATMPTRLIMPTLKKLNKTLNTTNNNKTMTLTNKDSSQYKSLNRVNKFFRSLFGLNKDNPSARVQKEAEEDRPSTKSSAISKPDEVVVATPPASAPATSKFTRMFSFRNNGSTELNGPDGNKNVKYTYTLATRKTTARLQSTSTTASSGTATTTNSADLLGGKQSSLQELHVSDEQPSRLSTTALLLPHINLDSLQLEVNSGDQCMRDDGSEQPSCLDRSIVSPSSKTTKSSTHFSSSSSDTNDLTRSSQTDTGLDITATQMLLLTSQVGQEKCAVVEGNNSFETFKEKFFAEIDERVRKATLAATNSELCYSSSGVSSSSSVTVPINSGNSDTACNQKSSISSIDSIDIPFIDDDDEYDEYDPYDHSPNHNANHTTLIYTASSSSSSSGNSSGSASPNSTLTYANVNGSRNATPAEVKSYSMDSGKLEELIRAPTMHKFDELAMFYADKYDYVCGKIAALFELTSQALQVGQKMNGEYELLERLREVAARYTHDKYSDWIDEQGGWVSKCFL
jgi:hypothetical protein